MVQTTRLFPRSMGRWLMALMLVMLSSLATRAAEAYACYTSSNTTLTFYYDNLRSSRTGTTYDLNTGSNDTDWETSGTNTDVTRVVFDSSFANARPTTTYSWFYGMENLQSITGISYLNTSAVTNMSWMFGLCENLTSLDVSHFNTSKVTNMYGMFSGCSSLTSLGVRNFNTANATKIGAMFTNCTGLTSLDLSSFNTAKVTDMSNMFKNCSNLTTIYAGSGWSTAAVTSSYSMFENCTSLVGGKGTTFSSSHVDKAYAHIDGGTSNPGYFTAGTEAYASYSSLSQTLAFYYDNQRASHSGTTYDLNTGNSFPAWYYDNTNANVTKVAFDPSFAGARPTSTIGWFKDMQRLTSITGMNYLNTSEVTNMSQMFFYCRALTSLDLSRFNTAKVTNMRAMFFNCSSLTTLDVSGFNTSKVTDMYQMFCANSNLQTIYVKSGWSTAAVTNSSDMFYNCTNLVGGMGTTFDANHTDATYAHIDGGTANPGYLTERKEAYACYTSSNTTLTFYYDGQRSSRTGTTYDLNTGTNNPRWNTNGTNASVTKVVFDPSFAGARPTTAYSWFDGMNKLTAITGMSYLNTSEVTIMNSMFWGCSSLTSLDLSNFNTTKVSNMGNMFNSCGNLSTIYASSSWTTAAVTYSSNMFSNCTSLVGGMGTTYNANHTDKAYAHIDGGTSNPGYFTDVAPVAYACYTPSNTTLTFYYDNQRSSRPGTTYDLNTGNNNPEWYNDLLNISTYSLPVTRVVFDPSFANARPTTTYSWFYRMGNLESITGLSYLNTANVTNMSHMFYGCSSLTSLNVSNFNTSNVTDMEYMFFVCSSLTSLNVSSFNTSNVTDMEYMFFDCSSLTSLDVSNFNTSNVTNMGSMLSNCSSLTSLDLSNFNTSKVTNMHGMFSNCLSLTSLDLSNFNTSKVTEMNLMFAGSSGLTSLDLSSFNTSNLTSMVSMFSNCSSLTSLDVSNFNTSKVTRMTNMFSGCSGLTSLNLSSFNTSNVTEMYNMFQDCSSLQTVYVDSSWSTAAVTGSYNMFTNCTNLVGGMGTTYDSSHTDKAYAHIDGGPSNPGYLTEKPAFVRGDVNGDGQVKINDVTALINFLLSHNGTGINLHAADANQSGGITISDVTALINFLLSGRWP